MTPYVGTVPETWVRGGFLDPSAINDRRDIARFASPRPSTTRVVLVLAEAWVGKSYVAHKITKALRDRKIDVHLTSFEKNAPDYPDDEFLKRSIPRVWIVDAVDQADRRDSSIKMLGRSVGGQGLTTLVFGRPDATLPEVEGVLGFSEGELASDSVERFKLFLLPLDRDQARRELGGIDEARFGTLLQAATQLKVALTFAELRALERIVTVPGSIPNLGAIRTGIARERCTRSRVGAGPIDSGGQDMPSASCSLMDGSHGLVLNV
jgi:hypothetical protein